MISVKVQGDLPGLTRRVTSIPAALQTGVAQWLQETSEFLAVNAALNAPILTGELRVELRPMKIMQISGMIVGGVVSPTPHALIMHEHQINFNMGGGYPFAEPPRPAHIGWGANRRLGLFGHGPITKQQPKTPEGRPGGKFITRVVNYHWKTWRTKLAETIRAAIEGGKATSASAKLLSTARRVAEPGGRIYLHKLREAMNLSRKEFDRLVLEAVGREEMTIFGLDNPRERSAERTAGAIKVAGFTKEAARLLD